MALNHQVVVNGYLSGIDEKEKQSVNEKAEWMESFNEQKTKADELKSQIDQTDSEIDGMV